MHTPITIIMAQLNFFLGDIAGNTKKIITAAQTARDTYQADAIVFPELAITGYPPEDLLFRPALHAQVRDALKSICQETHDILIIIGHPEETEAGLYNAASIIDQQQIIATYYKQHLPNYSVFDEKRYFIPGNKPCIIPLKNRQLGITICEDLWQEGPLEQAKKAGADLIICLNASPFHAQKLLQRQAIVREQQKNHPLPIVYVNCVGGQDELVFDGASMTIGSQGELHALGPFFEEALIPITFEQGTISAPPPAPVPEPDELIYRALVLGTRDYIQKNHFPGVIIGLSGGIDSALTLSIAVDAIGAEHIHAVLMPSRYTSHISIEDAKQLAEQLSVPYDIISIDDMFQTFMDKLGSNITNGTDVTAQNIQARCRGIILMGLSNSTGYMVLTTGNKSETAVGYTTLYGDMAGGFAVLMDVPKTGVYQLAQYVNRQHACIPQRILDRPPSAELAPQQTDQDSLPPYEILDGIMSLYVEHNRSVEDIIAEGFTVDDVHTVTRLIDRNEYKRRQAPPGVRISHRAFGRDWRQPITSGFKQRYEKN